MANFAGNLAGFDATQVKPQDSLDPLPAGWYPVVITESEFKPTKAGTGEYLELTLTVIEGEYEGRKIWDRLNLKNPSETAVKIAQGSLSAICHAVGVLTPNDSADLHDKPFEVKVSVKPGKDEYEPSNEVKGYRPLGGGESAPAAAAQVSAPPSTQSRAPRVGASAGHSAAPVTPGVGNAPWKQRR